MNQGIRSDGRLDHGDFMNSIIDGQWDNLSVVEKFALTGDPAVDGIEFDAFTQLSLGFMAVSGLKGINALRSNVSFRLLYDSPFKTILRTPFTKNGRYLSGFKLNNFRFQFHKHRLFGSANYLPHINLNNYHIMLSREGIRDFGFIFKS